MRKCLLLTKVLFRNSGSDLYKQIAPETKHRFIGFLLVCLLAAVCVIPIALMLFQLGQALYHILASANLGYLAYDIVCLALSFSCLLFSLPFTLSIMFFAKDIEFLLPMPLYSWQVAGAKFFNVLLYEYLTIAIIGIPTFAGIGMAANQGILFAAVTLLILLAIPVLPICYGCFIGVLFLSVTRKLRHRESIMTVFSVLILAASVCLGMFSSYLGDALSSADILDVLSGNRRLIMQASYLFPNLKLAQSALQNSSLSTSAIYMLSAFAIIFFYLIIADRLYLKNIVGIGEVSQRREKLSSSTERKILRRSNISKSFAIKEWRLLVRTPTYFLNCIISTFIVPIILLVMLLVAAYQGLSENGFSVGQLRAILIAMPSEHLIGFLMVIIFALDVMMCSMNTISATCISREGQGYIYMKYIPVPYKKQLQGKLTCALLVSYAATFPCTLLLVVFSFWIFRTPIWLLIPAIAITAFTGILITLLQLLGDLWKPKLNWTNEQAAVKQNLIAFLSALVTMLLCLLITIGCILLYAYGISVYTILAGFIALLAILTFMLRPVVYRYGAKALERM